MDLLCPRCGGLMRIGEGVPGMECTNIYACGAEWDIEGSERSAVFYTTEPDGNELRHTTRRP